MEVAPIGSSGAIPTLTPRENPTPGDGFREVLESATERAGPYVVKGGDTLSQIVLDRMKALGTRPTVTALYNTVGDVARANGLADPDFIRVGQPLDLAILVPKANLARFSAPLVSTVAAVDRIDHGVDGSLKMPKPNNPWQVLLGAPARVTSDYGPRRDPINGQHRYHDGIDLAAARGTPIRSVRPGRVAFSGWWGGYGNTVIVLHSDGAETIYAHNARNTVRRGDRVKAGTEIGRVGSTGRSTGPHLHFEVRRNGRSIEPLGFLSAPAPRLARAG